MNRKRYITALSEKERLTLQPVVKRGTTPRERQRAQAILWSYQGKDMATLLDWLPVDRDTLSSRFTRWQSGGTAALRDKPRSGRQRKITEEEEKKSCIKLLLE